MPYDAVTIDANIAIQEGLQLHTGLLAQLAQFKVGPIDFVLSEIVSRELLKHLTHQTKKTRDALLNGVRRSEEIGLAKDGEATALKDAADALGDPKDVARDRLGAFISSTGAEVIPADLAPVAEIVRAYFSSTPPFDPAGPKKSEFPDALALVSLEKWAEKSGKKLLVVTEDGGWKAFADACEHIDVEPDLAKALEVVQEHTAAAHATVSAVLTAVEAGQSLEQANSIEGGIEASLKDWTYMADGSGSFFLEADTSEFDLISYEFIKDDGEYDVTIVRIGNEVLSARVGVNLKATARADFSLSIWDSIDKEYVGMGGTTVEQEEEFEGAILLTLAGDLAGPVTELDVEDVEVVEAIDEVDFGEVEMDYGDDDEFDALMAEEAEADVPGNGALAAELADGQGDL